MALEVSPEAADYRDALWVSLTLAQNGLLTKKYPASAVLDSKQETILSIRALIFLASSFAWD